ncbi:L,D-transpeptidase [Streptomyces sp. NPDC001941]|uniref:L,D-transpeptidase n=1 Tax=Streptomyces sp. NPDC001941 TaxID=3154659 RepID=UPI00331A6D25
MPDDELRDVLRDLAGAGQVPPSVSGEEIRRRAGARGRRRRAVGAGAAAVVALGMLAVGVPKLLHARVEEPAPPAASRTSAPPSPKAPAVVVDVSARRLTAGRDGRGLRVLPVLVDKEKNPPPAGRMTVTAKYARKDMPASGMSDGYVYKTEYVIELTGSGGSVYYLFGTRFNTVIGGSALALSVEDAHWLYGVVVLGDVVEVR